MRRLLLAGACVLGLSGCVGMPHPIDCALGITLYAGYCDLEPGSPGYIRQHPATVQQAAPPSYEELYAKERARLDYEAAKRR